MSVLKQVTFDSASRRKDKSFRYSFITTTEQTDGEDIAKIFNPEILLSIKLIK